MKLIEFLKDIKQCPENDFKQINQLAISLVKFIQSPHLTSKMKAVLKKRFLANKAIKDRTQILFMSRKELNKLNHKLTSSQSSQTANDILNSLSIQMCLDDNDNHKLHYYEVTVELTKTRHLVIIGYNLLDKSRIRDYVLTLLSAKKPNIFIKERHEAKQKANDLIKKSLKKPLNKWQVIHKIDKRMFSDFRLLQRHKNIKHLKNDAKDYYGVLDDIKTLYQIAKSNSNSWGIATNTKIYEREHHHNLAKFGHHLDLNRHQLVMIILNRLFKDNTISTKSNGNCASADDNAIDYLWNLNDDADALHTVVKSPEKIWVHDLIVKSPNLAFAPKRIYQIEAYQFKVNHYGKIKYNKHIKGVIV